MKNIIRQILREEFEYKQQLFDLLRSGDSDNIEMVKMISQGQGIDVAELLIEYFKQEGPPYFKILKHFDLSDGEIDYILYGIFGEPVRYSYDIIYDNKVIYNENGNVIYYEDSEGTWEKTEYDDYGKVIYYEDSYGNREYR